MNPQQRPYVPLPDFLLLSDQNLKYLDVLVYTAFRWFNNVEKRECFPMHETVGKLAGLSKRFVIESVKRLEAAKVINVKRDVRKRVSNFYYFAKPSWNKRKEKIPKDFFELTRDLTANERAMLLCLRQFFHHGFAQFSSQNAVSIFATWLGLTEPAIRKQLSTLIKKGYIAKKYVLLSRSEAKTKVWLYLTDRINWNFNCYSSRKPSKAVQRLLVA